MSKTNKELTPLEALERLHYAVLNQVNYYSQFIGATELVSKDKELIEQALKQAQKDKEMLNIFKNALIIEHDLSTPSFTSLGKDKTFSVSAIITETIKIKQNDLDEKLRKSLREWVLENAFPKEFKALNEILALHDKWLGNEMSDFEFFTLLNEVKDKYGLLKEVLL